MLEFVLLGRQCRSGVVHRRDGLGRDDVDRELRYLLHIGERVLITAADGTGREGNVHRVVADQVEERIGREVGDAVSRERADPPDGPRNDQARAQLVSIVRSDLVGEEGRRGVGHG